MKRFVKKLALGLAVLMALILSANALFVRTAHYRDLGDVEKFSAVPEHIRLSSFGNSHSLHSFAWQEYHHAVTMSFSLGSQTYTYDYAVLTQFWDEMEEGGYVFVALSHFSLYALNEVRWVPRYFASSIGKISRITISCSPCATDTSRFSARRSRRLARRF